ncbi:MAG: SDR family NAD(P)-dependent oxidoreductase [Acidimicrobiales bacterium]
MGAIRLDGKVAVVTGAGGGLGRCHALLLAERGAKVVVNDLGGSSDGAGASDAPADRVVAEIRAAGGEAVANFDSVATPEGGAAIIQTALDAYDTVDIVVNNAGFLRDRSFAKMTADDIGSIIDVHLKGAFFVSQPAFVVMKERAATAASSTPPRPPACSATSARPTTPPPRWAWSGCRA